MATDTASRHTHRVIDTLLEVAATTGTTLPTELELDLEAMVNARYAGPPATELTKRLAALSRDGWAAHEDAFVRLASADLGTGFVWTELVKVDPDLRQASDLVKVGLLPSGDDLIEFLRRYATTDQALSAVASVQRAGRYHHELRLTADQVLDLTAPVDAPYNTRQLGFDARQSKRMIELVETAADGYDLTRIHMGRCHDLFVTAYVEYGPSIAFRGGDDFLARIKDDLTDELIGLGLPSLAMAVRWGRIHPTITPERYDAVVARPDGIAMLTYHVIGSFRDGTAPEQKIAEHVRTAAAERPRELLVMRKDAQVWAAKNTHIADDDVAVHVGTACQEWLTWKPTDAQIAKALSWGRVTARMVIWAAGHGTFATTRPELFARCVREAPGVAAEFVSLAATRHGSRDTAALEALLPVVAATLGDDHRIWEVLIGGQALEGPFADRPLAEAVAVYRDRYQQADARRAGR